MSTLLNTYLFSGVIRHKYFFKQFSLFPIPCPCPSSSLCHCPSIAFFISGTGNLWPVGGIQSVTCFSVLFFFFSLNFFFTQSYSSIYALSLDALCCNVAELNICQRNHTAYKAQDKFTLRLFMGKNGRPMAFLPNLH